MSCQVHVGSHAASGETSLKKPHHTSLGEVVHCPGTWNSSSYRDHHSYGSGGGEGWIALTASFLLWLFFQTVKFATTSPVLKSEETNPRWLPQSRSRTEASHFPSPHSMLPQDLGHTSRKRFCLAAYPGALCLLQLLRLPPFLPEHQLPLLSIPPPKKKPPHLSQASAHHRHKTVHL